MSGESAMKSFDTPEEKRIREITGQIIASGLVAQMSLGDPGDDSISKDCEFAYACLHAAVSAGKGENWNKFVEEALYEVFCIQEEMEKQ